MKSNKYEIGGITMNYVVESYENYQEENRLTTNNARKIEFLTTTRVFKEVICRFSLSISLMRYAQANALTNCL